MSWKSRGLTLALLGLIALFSLHLIDRWLSSVRVDLTDGDLYSLSEGSAALLERMGEEGTKPVDVTLFFSETTGKTLPKFVKDFIAYERYLRSLLGEYERRSDGRIRVRFVDPVPDSDEAEEAAEFGLDGKLINQNGDLFYFGLAFETETGSREVIDFLWPNEQATVEYESSRTLHQLVWPEKKKVGVLSSLEIFGGAQDPFMAQMMAAQGRQPAQKWIAVELLEQLYEVEPIDADADTISSDEIDLLVVIHPKDLPTRTLSAIDEYVVRGGSALVFVDPYSIEDPPPQDPQQPWLAMQYEPSSDLDPLLEAWGAAVGGGFAVDLDLAVRRPVSARGAAEAVIYDLALGGEQWEETVDTSSPILQGLADLRFLLAGTIELADDAAAGSDAASQSASAATEAARSPSPGDGGLRREVLIRTTSAGAELQVEPGFASDGGLGYTDLNDPAKLRDSYRPGERPVVLAALVRGRFPSAYPDGAEYPSEEPERPPNLPPGIELPPPPDAEMITRPPVPEEERGEGAVMVFADADFLSDQIAFVSNPFGLVQAANDNHRVFLNAIDFLLGDRDLMAIRAAKELDRPFEKFDEIEAEAEKETLDRERQIRADIEQFQEELRAKQSEITSRNAALFQKNLQDEVDQLNERIVEANRELREIRKGRREAIERQESLVRFSVMGWMPLVLLALGVWLAYRRRQAAS
ncbi:MAG: hypothetical protein DWQ30_24750 [Acidobacteria bacterium]|nr:MAG: hypothetical protein DWQ30_24750 [Acidobacteriota bacterium]